jgi:2,4-dienoyl-CoA reductase-like NADH-dependent reductase (Old Yellow Enzyme family)
MVDYYRRRVEGGVSLVISESCAIDHPTSTAQPLALYMDDATVDSWAACVDAVHEAGGHMLIQLWHEGALRKEGTGGRHPEAPTISPSGLIHGGKRNGRGATAADLDELIEAYGRSALAARDAGADGIEIHAAHGYLMDQFLWADTNRRTDGYGGDDIRARVRLPSEIVSAVRADAGQDFLISFRFSQWKEVDYDARICHTPEELGVMLSILASAGVSVFHASTRYFWHRAWDTADRTLAGWCKALTDVPVITVGSVGLNLDVMTNLLEECEAESAVDGTLAELCRRFELGEFDLVAVGRSVIADPDWVEKVRPEIRSFRRQDIKATLEWDSSFVEEALAANRADNSHNRL